MTEKQQVNPIKELREHASLGQGELADKAGISRPYLSQIESGKYVPSPRIRRKLARALGCKPAELTT
jgi:DNA-binding XRE family transcriptional regulator